jgi:hypothetical protein
MYSKELLTMSKVSEGESITGVCTVDVPEEVINCKLCMFSINDDEEEILNCSHVFHQNCIVEWKQMNKNFGYNVKCPVCEEETIPKPEPPAYTPQVQNDYTNTVYPVRFGHVIPSATNSRPEYLHNYRATTVKMITYIIFLGVIFFSISLIKDHPTQIIAFLMSIIMFVLLPCLSLFEGSIQQYYYCD